MRNLIGRIGSTALAVFLLACILLGLLLVVSVPIEMWQKAQAESWPSRKAVVSLSSATLVRRSGITRLGAGTSWRADICGNYVDTGERVCVSRLRYGDFRLGLTETWTREAVARYPKGREIDVHFSPGNPQHTVLEARSPWTEMLVLLGMSVALLLLPAVLYFFCKR